MIDPPTGKGTVVDFEGDTAQARSYLTEIGVPLEGDGGYFNHGVYYDDLVKTVVLA